jgi:hypothetical protein
MKLLCPEVEHLMEIVNRVSICLTISEMISGLDNAVVGELPIYGYRHVHERTDLGPFCSTNGVTEMGENVGLWIDPRPVLLHRIKENTIDIGEGYCKETLGLRMVQRDDDSILLTVRYGTILGSRWVALFKDYATMMRGSGV